jgi:hypothetical protein
LKIWYLVADNSDGSSSVDFFRTEEDAKQAYEGWGDEIYNCNETGPESFEVADGPTTIPFMDWAGLRAELEKA